MDSVATTCPFCGAFILVSNNEWLMWDNTVGEPYICSCGAIWYALIPDEVNDDARSD